MKTSELLQALIEIPASLGCSGMALDATYPGIRACCILRCAEGAQEHIVLAYDILEGESRLESIDGLHEKHRGK